MLGRTMGVIALLSFCLVQPAAAQQPPDAAVGKKDHATAVKESLQKSMAALRQYQWVETTVVSMKGEEKSRTQSNCFYGADGKVQKTPVAAPPLDEGKQKRGVRGKVVEHKKEEISDSTKEAVVLVKQYVPPDPDRIQAAKAWGRVTVKTFTDSAKDAVGLKVAFGAFADGTVYPATIQLDVAAQKLAVAIENSGYKKLGNYR